MSILDRLDYEKRKNIESLMLDHTPCQSGTNRFFLKDDPSISFYKYFERYLFNDDLYYIRSNTMDPKEFLNILKENIKYQIEHLETIQKILWGMAIYTNIPYLISRKFHFTEYGIQYEENDFSIDFLKLQDELLIYKKCIEISKTCNFLPKRGSIILINFNKNEPKILLENLFAITPIYAFYPKTNHEKIEYVKFLKEWAKLE